MRRTRLLDASQKQEIRRRAAELKQVERRLAEVGTDFAKNLALLKRDVLDEDEFRKANEARRDERARLTGRQTELTEWLAQQRERQEAVGSLPTRVRSFQKGRPGARHAPRQGAAPDDPGLRPRLPRRAHRVGVQIGARFPRELATSAARGRCSCDGIVGSPPNKL